MYGRGSINSKIVTIPRFAPSHFPPLDDLRSWFESHCLPDIIILYPSQWPAVRERRDNQSFNLEQLISGFTNLAFQRSTLAFGAADMAAAFRLSYSVLKATTSDTSELKVNLVSGGVPAAAVSVGLQLVPGQFCSTDLNL